MINYVDDRFARRMLRQARVQTWVQVIGFLALALLVWGLSWQVERIGRYLSGSVPESPSSFVAKGTGNRTDSTNRTDMTRKGK